jgi:penicillin-insensitive murein endopeptidase
MHWMRALWDVPVAAAFLLLALLWVFPGDARAEKTKWALARQPAEGTAGAIGTYTAGCVRGAVRLPLHGPGFEVMRPARRRTFGHPVLVDYLKKIAATIKAEKVGPILIGDLAQPKGGPSPRGHASHQSGLDVDIWFWHPRQSERRHLTRRERGRLSAALVVDPKKKKFTKAWSDEVTDLLRIAASEPEVSRVLVNPLIKQRLCEEGKLDAKLLRIIRPWYGHADHMHVRLHCPKEDRHCVAQKSLPEGDGCDTLHWWFDEKAQAARRKGKKSYLKKVGATPELPVQCDDI